MKCKVTERPQRVKVERENQTHEARWEDNWTASGNLFEVKGDANLLRAVMTAWLGDQEFELTDEELVERGGGWWTPGMVPTN